jgi:large conductance mechanosensitive channel
MDPLKKIVELEPTKKVLSLYDEFKTFAFKGNVIDLAVAVIIGAAFGKIVDALVKQIMMPIVSIFLPTEQSYTSWEWNIDGKKILYGAFLGELINFLVVTLAVFLFVVKFLGWILKFKKQEEAVPEVLTKEQQLLTEIRDLLKLANAQPPSTEKSQP